MESKYIRLKKLIGVQFFGSLKDKFGINWLLNYQPKNKKQDEA